MTAPTFPRGSAALPDATTQDGTYPRPQLVRARWTDLSGPWDFAWDDSLERTPSEVEFHHRIEVPFPPESPASGLGDTAFHPCVWYRRTITPADLEVAGFAVGDDDRLLLHFGAVDHDCEVWLNGALVATHSGGQTPFSADVTAHLTGEGDELVVRAVDLPSDVSILRGKQDWRQEPHTIWYHRTTGIWQPVWLEAVPATSIAHVAWRSDLVSATVDAEIELRGRVDPGTELTVALRHAGELLAQSSVRTLGESIVTVRLVIPRQLNGQAYEELLWSPDRPTLLSATVSITGDGASADEVASYVGLRSVGTAPDALLLNDRPVPFRAVLAQNYWPETHNAATAEMLRREVELILELGFTAARVHQKAEDPRFLFWADRLGLMIWGETASAYAFDRRSMTELVTEWSAIVRRDSSHPSIVTWVPLNESWGVQHISHDPRQQAFSRSIADLTRALDGTRPVISNDGWEHTRSDIVTIHDYECDPSVLAERYGSRESLQRMLDGFGPAGRRMTAGVDDARRPAHDDSLPVMLTEFGGVSLATGTEGDWGYATAADPDGFESHVTDILGVVGRMRTLAGYCYTQLTDTGQETNGLLYADRTPKFPIERIRAAVQGRTAPVSPEA
ncbi:glycoside hydrolase family 2 [Humibacter sp. BT305]|nr:glycoside hydrolase family 2 [Humibacter sp. BT305]